jgi:uncharacterized protein YfaS (alpha-2-macroglobulin family)
MPLQPMKPLVTPKMLGVVVAVALVAAVVLGLVVPPRTRPKPGGVFDKLVISQALAKENFELTATKSDAFGVDPDTTFVLKSKTPVGLDAVKASLTITPEVPVTVKANGQQEFTIDPETSLAAGTVYQIALGSTVQKEGTTGEKQTYSWAYQPKSDLRIVGTLPRHQVTGVPIDTGIDITFNTDRIQNLDPHFTITPETPGRFERHGRVVSFVPKERLSTSTLYTVTVTKGLGIKDSSSQLPADTMFQFETAAAATPPTEYYGQFSQAFTAVRPNEPPVMSFGYAKVPKTASATVYRFASASDLMERYATVDRLPGWAYASRDAAVIPTDGLTKVGTYDLELVADVLRFPDGFSPGLYLVDLPLGKRSFQSALIVGDIATSLTVTETDSLFWLYDLGTKKPVSGATVRDVLDGTEVQSNAQGLARIATPAKLIGKNSDRTRSYFTVSAPDGRSTLVPVVPQRSGFFYGLWGERYGWSDDYWSYFWADRTLYHPNDTVNVWGVARSRANPKIEDVRIEVWSWNFVDANGEYIPIVSSNAKTGPTGSFSASLKLTQLKPGYYTISAKIGGVSLATRSFEVKTFTKPAFRITATPNRLLAIRGESLRIDVTTEFFDGTPAPNVALKYDSDKTLTTDAMGRATQTETLEGDDERPRWFSRSYYPAESTEGDMSASIGVSVLPAEVTFTPTVEQDGDRVTVSFTLRKVVRDDPSQSAYQLLQTGPVVPDAAVTGVVNETITTKTKRGEVYDFIEKQVIDEYNYSYHTEQRAEFSGTTNAQGVFTKTLTVGQGTFQIILTASDAQGRTVRNSVYVYGGGTNAPQYNATRTTFSVRDARQGPSGPQPSLGVGESTEIIFQKNGEEAASTGAFLFVRLRKGLVDATVHSSARFPVTFSEADIPNVYFTAVWFDGSGFRAPTLYDTVNIPFDPGSRSLTVTVEPDKSQYGPGETARLAVSIRDAAGKPVEAAVSLSAIDEALTVAQWENAPSPLASLYRSVRSGLLQTYVSHAPLSLGYGAEGGGGGDGARKEFSDAPLFVEVETGPEGTAVVPFKLPDNLTSWRLTAQAVTRTLSAGHSVTMLPVRKPVFGLLTMPDEVVASDRPTVLARAYGTGLKTGDAVAFTLETPGAGDAQRADGKAFEAQRFTLPKLKTGAQEIRLTVQKGADKDVLVRTLTMLASRLTRTTSELHEATVGLTLAGADDSRTTLVFSDLGRGRILDNLHHLVWGWGKRLERHLAARIARDALAGLDARTDGGLQGFEPLAYQQSDGGVSQITYGDSDLKTSAWAAARPDLFDRERLAAYLAKKLQEKNASREQIGLALLGLARLGEPVLPDIAAFLDLPEVTGEDRLTAALAYLALGDRSSASELASGLLKDFGETQEPFVRLKLGKTNDDYVVNTAAFSVLAEGLKLSERTGVDGYLDRNVPEETLSTLERAVAQVAAVPLLDDATVSLRFRLSGSEQTVELAKGATRSLSVTSEELKTFAVTAVSGPAAITVESQAPLDVGGAKKDSRLGVNRTYSVYGASGRGIREGDVVRVDVDPTVKRGVIEKSFLVTDLLPSGLVLVTRLWERGLPYDEDLGYPIEVNGQRLTFYSDGNDPFHYYARVLAPGAYAAEPTVLQGYQSDDILNYGGAQTVEIR